MQSPTLNYVFGDSKFLIGMIHLPASIGYPTYPGKQAIIKKALVDLHTLEKAGFDAVLIENDNDQPHRIDVQKEVAFEFEEIAMTISKVSKIPVGIELLYDMKKTVEIGAKLNLFFVRLDVFADTMSTKWGIVPKQGVELCTLREKLSPNLLLISDIQVKHAIPVTKRPLEESVRESIKLGADAIIVTGELTGIPPKKEKCIDIKKAAGNTPILVGSGVDLENAMELLSIVDGAIVGTSIKSGEYIDPIKASQLVKAVRKVRNL